MANGTDERHRHFFLDGVTETEPVRSRGGGSQAPIPARDRAEHGGALRARIEALRPDAAAAREAQQAAGINDGLGLSVKFESFPDIELAFESLARERSGIELLNVRHEENRTCATIFVPDGKLDHFERLISSYLEERRDRRGFPRDIQRLLDAIRDIRAASLKALWTDDPDTLPIADEGRIWWEVWLPVRGQRDAVVAAFRKLAGALDMQTAPGELYFPERAVLLVRASLEQMQRSVLTLNSIAELRPPKESADCFNSLQPEEQREWLDDLLSRTRFAPDVHDTSHVCLLDTGVNIGHPLIAPSLASDDMHTVEPDWGTDDADGHGTGMAGLTLTGDPTELLSNSSPVQIDHRLESVKLLPEDGAGGNDPRLHGWLTEESVARPEVTAPSRLRVFGLAVTARDNQDRGRPSAWSAVFDSLAADVDEHGSDPRLLIVSADYVEDPDAWRRYPDSDDTDSVYDPAQSWNALTVGAYTQFVTITESDADDLKPIAPRGALSPFSTTSLTWKPDWPFKPDVVFEGGNAADDSLSAVWIPSLSLLTALHQPTQRLLTTTNATSAATALASRFAAQVMAVYPDLWPETVRALIVHAAEWTDAQKRMYRPPGTTPSKADYVRLLRGCGFGVPNLDRALWTVANSLIMIVQGNVNPLRREPGRNPVTRDMHLHNLPWPTEILEDRGETQVEMRVTLSYLIEPNPSGPFGPWRPLPLPISVPRPPLLRETNVGGAGRLPRPCQCRSAGRRGGNQQGRRGPGVADRFASSPPGLVAWRYLAGLCRRPRQSRTHRDLSCPQLVENPAGTGAIRQSGAIRSGGQHQSAGSRYRFVRRSGEPDRRRDRHRELTCSS